MPSGRQIFAFFCSAHDHRAQNSGCGDTALSFYTASFAISGQQKDLPCPAEPNRGFEGKSEFPELSSTGIRAEFANDPKPRVASRRCSALGITVNSYTPVCTLARALIDAGHDPEHILEVSLRGKLATFARLTVQDSNFGSPRFKRLPEEPMGWPHLTIDSSLLPLHA